MCARLWPLRLRQRAPGFRLWSDGSLLEGWARSRVRGSAIAVAYSVSQCAITPRDGGAPAGCELRLRAPAAFILFSAFP